MDPSSIGAARHYQIAQQALKLDSNASIKTANNETQFTAKVAEGAETFSNVFETVETSAQAMAVGQGDAHSVVEALANAEVALEAAVTIRNRVVEAYQELMRMPV